MTNVALVPLVSNGLLDADRAEPREHRRFIGGKVSNEQMARECVFSVQPLDGRDLNEYLEVITRQVAALLARRALEEAKWWEHLATQAHEESCGSKTSFDPKGCMYCERIAALEQAAAGKAAGGERT